jgi:GTP-binding protein HflX
MALQLKRALLIAYPDEDRIQEAKELALAAGYDPVSLLTQRYLFRARFGVGEGKAEEAARVVREEKLETILFDSRLKTGQAYNLAKLCRVEVKDREKIILEIFAKRASTAEAKIQVELAELGYQLPRAKDMVRKAKGGEQPGFFGLGKYEVDVYVRMMKKRIGGLRSKAKQIEKRRNIFRASRERGGFLNIALAGYTGSGKTTLFNRLTSETKDVDSGVFTTLSPTTRRFRIDHREALLTDTVGFISDLPAYLVDAFKSTLEQVSYADLVLLLLDVSQSETKLYRRYEVCLRTLADLAVPTNRIFPVLNKRDLVSRETERGRAMQLHHEAAVISARTGEGVPDLKAKIEARLVEAQTNAQPPAEPTAMEEHLDWR